MQQLRDAIENMLRETLERGDTLAPGWRDEIRAIVRNIIEAEREAIIDLAAKQGWAMKNEDPFEDSVREICDMRQRSNATELTGAEGVRVE